MKLRFFDRRRRACRTVLDHLFHCLVTWLAPMGTSARRMRLTLPAI
jgi:hypothetical protein